MLPDVDGSLYAVHDFKDVIVKDDVWFDYHIKVQGKHITITINDKVTADYEEKADVERDSSMKGRRVGSGTFAFQAHDPGCEVHYKDIMVKAL